jgi:hypothetical protein
MDLEMMDVEQFSAPDRCSAALLLMIAHMEPFDVHPNGATQ